MFIKYLLIGILNTALHWLVFFFCLFILMFNQGIANLIAFICAVTFSFFMNAKFTFNKEPTSVRYLFFIVFMGGISFCIGILGDKLAIYPIITLIMFSILSLFLGFIYSKFIVFK